VDSDKPDKRKIKAYPIGYFLWLPIIRFVELVALRKRIA
jgi:hypothetical protein